jgi:hypothetical protein
MGIDASLFSRKTKSYIYIDREYNILNKVAYKLICYDSLKNEGINSLVFKDYIESMISISETIFKEDNSCYHEIIKWLDLLGDDDLIFIINDSEDRYIEFTNSFNEFKVN